MSLKRLQKIKFNILDKIGQVEKLIGKEGDNLTRGLEVQLLNNNIVVDDISTIDCMLIAKQKGAGVEDTFVVPSIKVNNKFEIIYPSNLMKKGIVEGEIRFTQGEQILTSFIFEIDMARTLVVEEITDSIYEQRLIDVIVEVVANEEERIANEEERQSNEIAREQAESNRDNQYEQAEANRDNLYEGREDDRDNLYEQAESERDNLYEQAESERDNLYEQAEQTRDNEYGLRLTDVEGEVDGLIARIGNNSELDTTEKSKIILAINEVYGDLNSHLAEFDAHLAEFDAHLAEFDAHLAESASIRTILDISANSGNGVVDCTLGEKYFDSVASADEGLIINLKNVPVEAKLSANVVMRSSTGLLIAGANIDPYIYIRSIGQHQHLCNLYLGVRKAPSTTSSDRVPWNTVSSGTLHVTVSW